MKKYLYWLFPGLSLIGFVIWTILVKVVDVQYVQMNNTYLGFYNFNTTINDWVQTLNTKAYDVLSTILLIFALLSVGCFAILGLIQWIKRKSLKKVDPVIYMLLIGYIVIAIFYIVFEVMKINYSPLSTITDLKSSYPCSHIFISTSYLGISFLTMFKYFNFSKLIKGILWAGFGVFTFAMIFTRTFSGCHWFSDVIAAILLSCFIIGSFAGFLILYKDKELVHKVSKN